MFPLLLLGGGVAVLVALSLSADSSPVPDHKPDLPPTPGSTRYRLVDKILSQLTAAAQSSGVPLGLLIGWIAKESGGRLDEVTKLDERGYFQLMPSESKKLGVDHQRLSTDSDYSINAGLALIGYYMGFVDRLRLDSVQKGSPYYWRLVKLMHTVGDGAATKWIHAAEDAGVAGSWESLEKWLTAHDSEMLHLTKHSPLKWLPFIDAIYQIGAPFGFGSDNSQPSIVGAGMWTAIFGGKTFDDIPDPIDYLS